MADVYRLWDGPCEARALTGLDARCRGHDDPRTSSRRGTSPSRRTPRNLRPHG